MKLCIDCKYYVEGRLKMFDTCTYEAKQDLVRGGYEIRYCDTRRVVDCKKEAIFFKLKEQKNVN